MISNKRIDGVRWHNMMLDFDVHMVKISPYKKKYVTLRHQIMAVVDGGRPCP